MLAIAACICTFGIRERISATTNVFYSKFAYVNAKYLEVVKILK